MKKRPAKPGPFSSWSRFLWPSGSDPRRSASPLRPARPTAGESALPWPSHTTWECRWEDVKRLFFVLFVFVVLICLLVFDSCCCCFPLFLLAFLHLVVPYFCWFVFLSFFLKGTPQKVACLLCVLLVFLDNLPGCVFFEGAPQEHGFPLGVSC